MPDPLPNGSPQAVTHADLDFLDEAVKPETLLTSIADRQKDAKKPS